MPRGIIEWYLDMIPILTAEEALHQMTVQAVGGGHLDKKEAKKIMKAWERTARRYEEKKLDPEQEKKNVLMQMMVAGIPARTVQVKIEP